MYVHEYRKRITTRHHTTPQQATPHRNAPYNAKSHHITTPQTDAKNEEQSHKVENAHRRIGEDGVVEEVGRWEAEQNADHSNSR